MNQQLLQAAIVELHTQGVSTVCEVLLQRQDDTALLRTGHLSSQVHVVVAFSWALWLHFQAPLLPMSLSFPTAFCENGLWTIVMPDGE